MKSLGLSLESFLVKYFKLCLSYLTFHITPLVSEYEFASIILHLALRNIVFHCLLQKCPVSRAAKEWLLFLLLPPLTILILAQEVFVWWREHYQHYKKRCFKTFLLRKNPVVKQQKGIPQQFTNWILICLISYLGFLTYQYFGIVLLFLTNWIIY